MKSNLLKTIFKILFFVIVIITFSCQNGNKSNESGATNTKTIFGKYRARKPNKEPMRILTNVDVNEYEITLNNDSSFEFKRFNDGTLYKSFHGTFSSFEVTSEKKEFGSTVSSNKFKLIKFKFNNDGNTTYSICSYEENQLMTLPDPPDKDAYNGTGEDNLCESSDFVILKKT